MISKELSQKLYADLINGKTVNKHNYQIKTNELAESPLYNEVFNNLDEYKVLYENINFELVHKHPGFFYIRELNGDEANETTIKIQALLIVIGRIVTERGYLFDTLTDYRAGIKSEDLVVAMEEERYTDILHTCKLCKDRNIETEIKNNLISRELMFINSRGHYVLSNAGQSFFSELKDSYERDV
ncbi:condensin complex protein MksE [Methyloglobulus sp.]|uniref:condensin complex protein MksE n=1 Tax=Methyloglobulus sp. TaxID=2518622 RepID=UPI00398A171B